MGTIIGMIKGKFKEKTREELCIEGDKEAFVELIDLNRLSMYRVAKGILKDDHKVEDAIGSTIIKAYENVVKLKKHEFFKTWLIRILINECNLIIKKESKVVYLEDTVETSKEDSYKDIDLIDAIEKLDKELREVTVLYYFEDMQQKEIGKVLKINDNTVRTRLHRARKKLYEKLK